MSTKLKHQHAANQGGNNVVAMPSKCTAEGCGKKSDKLTFCGEHYAWFKWGLLTKEGKRPSDFDKKYQAFVKNQKAA